MARCFTWIGTTAALLAAAGPAPALPDVLHHCTRDEVGRVNRRLAGQLLDFTANHGVDRRPFSDALGEKRDLYVYVPPGYDGRTPFPVMIWLHGIAQDERHFLTAVELFDRGVRAGIFPPMVIAAPDGHIRGRPTLVLAGSFYLNTNAGRFEDYVVRDVWGFVRRHFAVRAERDAHVLAGASMGGFGAFNLGFKHRTEFGHLAGLMPPLDLRYADCRGRYFANFDPDCVAARDELRPNLVVGRFYGVVPVRQRRILNPLYGRGNPGIVADVSANNPVEMLTSYDVRPGEFGMFVGWGTKDEFNIDAQCEHFVDVARRRGVVVETAVVPGGRHSVRTATDLNPQFAKWLTARVGPYVPPRHPVPPPFVPAVPSPRADR